jgi:formiminotetrahydrofolate cyclodeaminase
MPIGTLFDQAAAATPTPGGGCVSAVCGYFGVSLLLKSIRVSARNHPEDSCFAGFEGELLALADKLMACAQEDSDAFEGYMRAVRLPKTLPEEIAVRQKAIHEAGVGATVSALEILDQGNAVLEIALGVQGRISTVVLAEERSAVELVSAMNSTAEWNAEANMVSLKDAGLAVRLDEAKARHVSLLAACRSVWGDR